MRHGQQYRNRQGETQSVTEGEINGDFSTIRKELSNDLDPQYIWALPEEGLEGCIDLYAFSGDSIPVILVYSGDSLVYAVLNNADTGRSFAEIYAEGKEAREQLLKEENAQYQFKEGTTPLDALVALIRLETV